jgi:hypothetical protein
LAQSTKIEKIIPNDHKGYKKSYFGQKIYQRFHTKGPPKCTQTGIFGMHMYHLATLVLEETP